MEFTFCLIFGIAMENALKRNELSRRLDLIEKHLFRLHDPNYTQLNEPQLFSPL